MYPLYAIAFTVELGLGIVSPLLPEIMQEFSLAAWQAGMMVTVFALARLFTDLPLGLLLERIDRTRVLALGTLLITLGSAGCGLAQDYSLLLAARLVMGTGTATCLLTLLFTISRAADAGSRGKAIGIYQASLLAGITFSPAIGGLAATLYGWRAAFFFCSVTGSLAMLMVLLASRAGSLRLPVAIAAPTEPRETRRAEEGTTRIPWNLVAINFTTFVFFASTSGFRNSMVPVYGGTELAIGAGILGLMLGGSALIRFAVTLGSGLASDRFGRKVILIPGTVLLATGTIGFVLARDPLGFGLCLAVLSLGGFGNSLPTTMIVDAVRPDRVGLAISINRFVGDLGMLVAPVGLGWVLDVAGFRSVAALTAGMLLATIPGIALAVHEKRPLGPHATLEKTPAR